MAFSRAVKGGVLAAPTRAGCSTAARAFVEHVLARLAPQVEEVVISANRNLERYATLGWPVVTDTVGKGPLAGLLRLLETARHDSLLCVPCDALDTQDLARVLWDALWMEDANIVVLHDGERGHPTSHDELRHEDSHAFQGQMGYTFGNDSCSVAGHDGLSLFPEKRKQSADVKVMQFFPRAKQAPPRAGLTEKTGTE